MHTHKIVDGIEVNLTQEEIAELEAARASYVPPVLDNTPTKEQLLAQLAELSAKINALGA